MDELLRNWDIGNVSVIEPIPSYWGKSSLVKTVDGLCFILKEKVDASRTAQEFGLLSNLSKVGAPVAVPIQTRAGTVCAFHAGKIFSLSPRLPGEIITEHYTGNANARAEMFGKAIGFLHTCLLKCDSSPGFREMRLIEQIQEWAIPWIQKYRDMVDGDAVEKIWGEVEREVSRLDDLLPIRSVRDPCGAHLPGLHNIIIVIGCIIGPIVISKVEKGAHDHWTARQAKNRGFAGDRPGHFHAEPIMAGGHEGCPGARNAPGVLPNDQSQLYPTL